MRFSMGLPKHASEARLHDGDLPRGAGQQSSAVLQSALRRALPNRPERSAPFASTAVLTMLWMLVAGIVAPVTVHAQSDGAAPAKGKQDSGRTRAKGTVSSTDPSAPRCNPPARDDAQGDDEKEVREGYRQAFIGTREAVYLLLPLLAAVGIAVLIVVYLNRRIVELSRARKEPPAVERDKNDRGEYVID